LKAFIPGRKYATVSITGSMCLLKCRFCEGKYLKGMYHVSSPKELYSLADKLWRRGFKGMLISGGFNKQGQLPLRRYLPVIKKIKEDFDFVISVHSGLPDKETIIEMEKAGVDVVDYQLVVDDFVIKEVMRLRNRSSSDFLAALKELYDKGLKVAVHIPVGLNYGVIKSEYTALDSLLELFNPHVLIFLVLIPTRGTSMEYVKPPNIEGIIDLIGHARKVYSGEIALGCMRPASYKRILDKILIEKQVIDRIALPPIQYIKRYRMEVVNACCSIPEELITRFK